MVPSAPRPPAAAGSTLHNYLNPIFFSAFPFFLISKIPLGEMKSMLKQMTFFLVLTAAWPAGTAIAQTTNINVNFNLTTQTHPAHSISVSNMSVAPFGVVTVRADLTYPAGQGGNGRLGDNQGTISLVFNRLDSFDVSVDIPDAPGTGAFPKNFTGSISVGAGAYKGATGTMSLTVRPDNFGNDMVTGNGSVTASGKTTSFTLSQPLTLHTGSNGDNNNFSFSGTVTPIGNATATFNLVGNQGGADGVLTLAFNSTDSVRFYVSYTGEGPPPPNTQATALGGTGAYAGAVGSMTINFGQTLTGIGSITQRGAGLPVPTITQVSTAYGLDETAQNAFIVIKGTNLVPSNTPKDGVIWSNAPEFASGMMPTVLQGISVKVNDVPAYVYFFCSAATDPACASDQLNVLTPLDAKSGLARVVVTNNGVDSSAFVVPMTPAEPSFLIFNTQGYVAAVHADGTLIGPTSLYPGYTTPAKVGETILAFAVGFGLPITSLVQGSSTQFGPLPRSQSPPSPQCLIGTIQANIDAATLISPGLYQFNLVVPQNTPPGDNLILCSYNGFGGFVAFTPAGNLLTVQ